MVIYLIESSVCLAVMLLIYRFTLARTSLHRFKRFYLLACLVLPLMLPLSQIDIYYGQAPIIERKVADAPVVAPFILSDIATSDEAEAHLPVEGEVVTNTPAPTVRWPMLILAVYALTILVLLKRFLTNIHRIRRLASTSEHKTYEGHRVILLKGSATAYSFFRLIFIGEEDYGNPITRKHLLSHELAHAHDWHSVDIILLELLRVILWFNPLYYALGKYIRLNHEYIADSQVLTQFGDSRTYQKLILNFASRVTHKTPLVSPSDFSFIKNRFTMMHKSTSSKAATVRVLLLITTVAGTFFTLAVNLKPRPAVFAETTQKTISVNSETPTGIPIASVNSSINVAESRSTFKLYLDDFYPGIDITAKAGRTVVATADGTVLEASEGDKKYGNFVLIDHGSDTRTLYASLSNIEVSKGEKVKRGDLLGTIGMSMRTSALASKINRVHYAVSKSDEWVDPYAYINLPSSDSPNKEGVVIPWAYPRALDIPASLDKRPDISPVEATPGNYMTFTGMAPGMNITPSSVFDTTIGTEFFTTPNTTVKATAAGTVTEVVNNHKSYGNYIKIRHDDLHETMYAKLDEILVTKGQDLIKGSPIARIGRDNEMFGRLHYKILRNGKPLTPGIYTSAAGSGSLGLSRFPKANTETSFNWKFPSGFAFKSISLDREKVVFTKQSGAVVTKTGTELSSSQKKALMGFTRKPFPQQAQRPVPKEVSDRWLNPKVYQIRIDNELTPNAEMAQYEPSDFAHCWWVVVGKSTRNLKGHAFELSLLTKEYYEKQKRERQTRMDNWASETKKLLAAFKEL